MLSLIKNMFDSSRTAINKKYTVVKRINGMRDTYRNFSEAELRGKTAEFKQRLAEGEAILDLLPEAFATVREASYRTLNMEHYDVQLIGGMVLHDGGIAEMKTGEGKTLVATLPVYLNALTGKSVHVVSVNDYLVKRDTEWMGEIYDFLNMSYGYIDSTTKDEDRKEIYSRDIIYATNNELGFDYLRDNMKFDLDTCVMRELNYAIIDEVDSILIDEARTPLIISGRMEDRRELYVKFDSIVKKTRFCKVQYR